MHVLVEIQPLNLSTGERETVRVASAQDRRITGLNGVVWVPALVQMPALSIRLFDGDFSSTVEPGSATFAVNLDQIAVTYPNVYGYLWQGAPVSIYAEEPGTAWPWTRRFVGKARRFEKQAKRLQLVAEVDTAALEKDVLYLTYAGTTGLEGGADLKDRVRPWVWGHVKGIEPIQIDIDNSVFQVSGYGAINAISAVYERGASFGDAMANHADYAALVAATIPPGRWATCLAQGLFRLGAPPFGAITADVQGHLVSGSVPRRTGAIIKAMASALSISSGSIDSASLDALDAAVARNINVYLTEQVRFIDLAQQLCLPCNAYSGMSWTGKFFAVRPVFGTATMTLHGQGRADPQVIQMIEGGVEPPFKKTIFGADRCWRVHTTTEIAYQDILVDRGRYSASETYRAGNLVDLADGSRWIYINATATAGNAPVEGVYWTALTPVTDIRDIGGTVIDLGTTFPDWTVREPGDIHIAPSGVRWIRRADTGIFLTDANGDQITDATGDAITALQWESRNRTLDFVEDGTGYRRVSLDDYNFITSAADDNVLDRSEKRQNNLNYTALLGEHGELDAQAAALGDLGTQRTATQATITALTAYLVALSPSYLDEQTDTPIVAAQFRTVWQAAYDGMAELRAAVAGRAAQKAIWDNVTGASKPEDNADVTANAQVVITPPPPQIIYRDYLGSPKAGQFNRVLTPVVLRGGTDIRTADAATYAITTSGVTATVNNTTGNADKGRITVTAGGAGWISLTVTVTGIALGPFVIPFTVQNDPPPSAGGGAGGVKFASDSTLAQVSSASFTAMTGTDSGETVFTVTLATGESLRGSAPLTYTAFATGSLSVALVAKWQYRLVGSGTWLDFDTAISGSNAEWFAGDFSANPGSIAVTQVKGGLTAGDYECRLVGALSSSSGSPTISVESGTASIIVS